MIVFFSLSSSVLPWVPDVRHASSFPLFFLFVGLAKTHMDHPSRSYFVIKLDLCWTCDQVCELYIDVSIFKVGLAVFFLEFSPKPTRETLFRVTSHPGRGKLVTGTRGNSKIFGKIFHLPSCLLGKIIPQFDDFAHIFQDGWRFKTTQLAEISPPLATCLFFKGILPLKMLDPQNPEAHSAKAADPTTVCLSSDEEVQLVSPFFLGVKRPSKPWGTLKVIRSPNFWSWSKFEKTGSQFERSEAPSEKSDDEGGAMICLKKGNWWDFCSTPTTAGMSWRGSHD